MVLGAINITESLIRVPSVTAFLQSPLFISFCPSLLLFFFLGASGHRILFVVLDGKGFFLPPICFHTCLLVCSQLVSLLLYLHCDSSLWVLSVKGISLSPVPHFSLHCSVFFVLVALGQDSSPICFRTRLSTSLSHVAVLSGCFRAQYAPCPLSVSVLVPLVLSNSCPYFSLSLSLLLFFSLGAYLDT